MPRGATFFVRAILRCGAHDKSRAPRTLQGAKAAKIFRKVSNAELLGMRATSSISTFLTFRNFNFRKLPAGQIGDAAAER